jgi:hypothetical protein
MMKKKEMALSRNQAPQQPELALWAEMDERTGDILDEQTDQAEMLHSLLTQQTVTVDRIDAVVATLMVTAMDMVDLMDRVEALEFQTIRNRSSVNIH